MPRLLPAGKAERGPYSSFATQVTHSEMQPASFHGFISFSRCSYDVLSCCLHVVLSRAFCPVRSPCPVLMPSPRLASNPAHSFTPTMEVILVGEPHRSPLVRRKIHGDKLIQICASHHFSCFIFYKEISLPHSLMAVKPRRALGKERTE